MYWIAPATYVPAANGLRKDEIMTSCPATSGSESSTVPLNGVTLYVPQSEPLSFIRQTPFAPRQKITCSRETSSYHVGSKTLRRITENPSALARSIKAAVAGYLEAP